MSFDSTPDTLRHSLRVGALMHEIVHDLIDRSVRHDLSKAEPPEVEVFNEVTPRLKTLTYGSDEYRASLASMGPALAHHYAHNRHHPEHHRDGIAGMTLADLVEMLADWQAASERHTDGDLARSLVIQRDRFGISGQLLEILRNTALELGWIPATCGRRGHAPNGEALVCNLPSAHDGPCADGLVDCLEFEGTAP